MKKKRIVAASAVLAVLISAYLVTSLMLAASSLEVRLGNHIFRTETMDIDIQGNGKLNGSDDHELYFSDSNGKPITLVEPGMTFRGDFCVVNDSTFDVYYRLYFSRLEGGLKDILQATILDKDTGDVIYGPVALSSMESAETFPQGKILASHQSRDMILELYFPKDAGNEYQNQSLSCEINVDMTQVRNNDGQEYDFSHRNP